MTAAELQHVETCAQAPPGVEAEKEALASQLRVEELEQKLRQRDEQLREERERGERARKKVKQLLAKLSERDARIAEQSEVVTELKTALREVTAQQQTRSSGNAEKSKRRATWQAPPSQTKDHRSPPRGGRQGRDNAIRERAQIVRQLEGHLAQMRANLAESESELLELEEMKLMKEAEWNSEGGALAASSSASSQAVQVHWQRLNMITQQLQEKQRFAAELTKKTRELEDQLAQQRSLIEDLCPSSSGDDRRHAKAAEVERGERANVNEGEMRDSIEAGLRASVALAAAELKASRAAAKAASALVEMPKGPSHAVDVQRDEALQAFLAAAGSTAEVVLNRPALHAAFETRPLELSVGALDDCSPEERLQAITLFVAYAAVTGDPDAPRALRISDICLRFPEAVEIGNTLESCGAQLQEWEMTRCPTNEATMRTLLKHLASHPLRQLNLGYDALGPVGASALMACTGAWSVQLQRLSLEMNGLGDAGCDELAGALAAGRLPALESLELGWNELSAACTKALASLLTSRKRVAGDDESEALAGDTFALRLRKLGLGGNKLGSDGACTLMTAALACPESELELDLSMNHVGVAPVQILADWVESDARGKMDVTVTLEWNIIDDGGAVTRLAEAISRSTDLTSCGRPFVRLANNELHELRPQDILATSRGLVSC